MRKIPDLTLRILTLSSEAQFALTDDDYDSLDWRPDNSVSKPTYEELAAISQEQLDQFSLPIATGKEIVEMAEAFFNTQDWEMRKQLQILFISTGIKPILESATCNPLSQSDFNLMVADLQKLGSINEEQRAIFVKLATEYAATHKFTA